MSVDFNASDARVGVCDTERCRMRFRDWGDSSHVLVLIHGLADRAISFAPLMAHLVPKYRCIAYELPEGAGDRANLVRYRHGDLANDVIALLDHLQIDQATPMGSSFGSTVALRALHDHPQRLPIGILQGGFAHRPLVRLERIAAMLARYFPGQMRHLPLIKQAQQFIDYPTFGNTSAEVWDFFRQCSGSARAGSVARRAVMLHHNDLRPMLPLIRQPILMIGGEDDRIVLPAMEQTALAGLPNVRRIEMPGCGHYPQYIQPKQMAELIHSFITSIVGDF